MSKVENSRDSIVVSANGSVFTFLKAHTSVYIESTNLLIRNTYQEVDLGLVYGDVTEPLSNNLIHLHSIVAQWIKDRVEPLAVFSGAGLFGFDFSTVEGEAAYQFPFLIGKSIFLVVYAQTMLTEDMYTLVDDILTFAITPDDVYKVKLLYIINSQ